MLLLGVTKGGVESPWACTLPSLNRKKYSGLPKIKYPDLRYTFASNFVMKGGSILSLKEILGHSDINTTMMYAYLALSYLEEEINRLDF